MKLSLANKHAPSTVASCCNSLTKGLELQASTHLTATGWPNKLQGSEKVKSLVKSEQATYLRHGVLARN